MDMSHAANCLATMRKVEDFLLFLPLATQHFVAVVGGVTREIFLATCLAMFVARQVARKISSCNMAFCSIFALGKVDVAFQLSCIQLTHGHTRSHAVTRLRVLRPKVHEKRPQIGKKNRPKVYCSRLLPENNTPNIFAAVK